MVWLDEPSRLGDRRHNVSDIVRERPGKLSNVEWIIKSLLFLYNVFKGETAGSINTLSILAVVDFADPCSPLTLMIEYPLHLFSGID
jgi:hypothetical protein